MLSRVAEHCYWMTRYLERAENTARIVNTTTNLLMDLPRGTEVGWVQLVYIMGSLAQFQEQHDAPSERNVMKFLISDEQHQGSILACLNQARENARTLRDVLPREAWEQINDLCLYAKYHAAEALGRRKRFDFLRAIVLRRQTVIGQVFGTMSHDDAYQFTRMGRDLERADMTTRIVDVNSTALLARHTRQLDPHANIRWMAVLNSLSAYHAYRKHVQARVGEAAVLGFLLQDSLFPRAVAASLGMVEDALRKLPNHDGPLLALGEAQRKVSGADVYALSRTGLHEFLDGLQVDLGQVHTAIARSYFRLTEPAADAG